MAAGAGRWIILEEIEQVLEEDNLKVLLKILDQELEATTTTMTFRVWITHTADRNNNPKNHPF